jgi:uncharacterized metal-binding protein
MSGDETDELLAKYLKNPQDRNIATVAALVESDYYCTATRAEEILIFAKRMGYKKVGVATCYGLLSECSQFTCYE